MAQYVTAPTDSQTIVPNPITEPFLTVAMDTLTGVLTPRHRGPHASGHHPTGRQLIRTHSPNSTESLSIAEIKNLTGLGTSQYLVQHVSGADVIQSQQVQNDLTNNDTTYQYTPVTAGTLATGLDMFRAQNISQKIGSQTRQVNPSYPTSETLMTGMVDASRMEASQRRGQPMSTYQITRPMNEAHPITETFLTVTMNTWTEPSQNYNQNISSHQVTDSHSMTGMEVSQRRVHNTLYQRGNITSHSHPNLVTGSLTTVAVDTLTVRNRNDCEDTFFRQGTGHRLTDTLSIEEMNTLIGVESSQYKTQHVQGDFHQMTNPHIPLLMDTQMDKNRRRGQNQSSRQPTSQSLSNIIDPSLTVTTDTFTGVHGLRRRAQRTSSNQSRNRVSQSDLLKPSNPYMTKSVDKLTGVEGLRRRRYLGSRQSRLQTLPSVFSYPNDQFSTDPSHVGAESSLGATPHHRSQSFSIYEGSRPQMLQSDDLTCKSFLDSQASNVQPQMTEHGLSQDNLSHSIYPTTSSVSSSRMESHPYRRHDLPTPSNAHRAVPTNMYNQRIYPLSLAGVDTSIELNPQPSNLFNSSFEFSSVAMNTSIKTDTQQYQRQYLPEQINVPPTQVNMCNQMTYPTLQTAKFTPVEVEMSQYQSQYMSVPSLSAQTLQANLPPDPFFKTNVDNVTESDAFEYQGQFISAPLLYQHDTQQRDLPNSTYPFLTAAVDSSAGVEMPMCTTHNIQTSLTDTNTQTYVTDNLPDIDLLNYQGYHIPTSQLPEAQFMQTDLPNPTAYPPLAAAIDSLTEMKPQHHSHYVSDQLSRQQTTGVNFPNPADSFLQLE